MELDKFEEFLSQGNMAKNTISAYLYAVKEFGSQHKELNKRNLLVYKTYLIETYKPKTVNLRIQALNKYLVFVGKTKLRLKSVKVQQRSYLENVEQQTDDAAATGQKNMEAAQNFSVSHTTAPYYIIGAIGAAFLLFFLFLMIRVIKS